MNEPQRDHLGIERIAFFSDAVMAIAITLLVIELKLPESDHDVHSSVFHSLASMIPKFFSYFLSFAVIALYWEAHHRMLAVVKRYDRAFVWLNICLLFFLALLPFPTAVLGDHLVDSQAIILYACNVAAIGIFRTWLWLHAVSGKRLVDATLSAATIKSEILRGAIVPVVFLSSLPIAFLAPQFTSLSWALIVPISIIGRRIIEKSNSPKQA